MSQLTQKSSQPGSDLRNLITSEKYKSQFAMVLPKHMTADRFTRITLTCLTKTPKLAECTQQSVMLCLLNLSQMGLEPDGRNAHLIPYENRKLGIVECQLIVDYKGYVELVMRSGLVSRIHADKICENDVFEYDMGEVKKHAPNFREERGKPYAYYVLVEMKDGSRKTEVMSLDEVDSIRKRSRASGSGPWVTDYDEMAKKTVFRRCQKWLTLSPEIRELLDKDDDKIVETTAVVVPQKGSMTDTIIDLLGPATDDEGGEQPTTAIETSAAPAKKADKHSPKWFLDQIRVMTDEADLLSLRQELGEAYKKNPALFPVEAELDSRLAQVRAGGA